MRDAARAGERDRYLAALLAPRRVRRDLVALAAFLGETARIPGLVREPMMGEIRLQWWREALEGPAATGSPVADALRAAIARHDLPRDLLHAILDARARALDPQFAATGPTLAAHLDATEGAAFRLAARILGVADSPAVGGLLEAAGQAYGRVRLGPTQGAWDRPTRPVLDAAKSWLAEVRLRQRAAPPAVLPAVLPVALVEPYLEALERAGPNLAGGRADISPLTRVWRLWRASMRGRI